MTELTSPYTFEGQTPGANATASSPWSIGSGSGTIIVSTAAAIHGSVGGRIAASSYKTINWTESSTSAARVIDWYGIPRAGSANGLICGLYDDGISGWRGDVRLNAANTMSIRNVSTAVRTSAIALVDGTKYRFAWRVATGGQELRVYEGESATPLFTLSGALTSGTHTRFLTGLLAASTGFQIDIDTIRIADDWLDPYDPPTPLAGLLAIKEGGTTVDVEVLGAKVSGTAVPVELLGVKSGGTAVPVETS